MNYQQTLDYLYDKLPMFTRDGASAFKKDLDNTLQLCALLDNPQHKFKSIHIAGTNGKGSTSHILAAILQTAGYQTGLYTSPHLLDFRERIRIDGEMIPEAQVCDFVAQYQSDIARIQPSFFELTVAMAFDFFANAQLDIAVIEVGLGGRLDSTNVIQPLLSVITNISLDHTALLGNTLPEIAYEKAGIIKPNTPVIIGEALPETKNVFLAKAEAENASIFFVEDEITAQNIEIHPDKITLSIFQNQKCIFPSLSCDLNGMYQVKNIITVIKSVLELRKQGFSISDEVVYKAMAQVKNINHLQGRWQKLQENPLVICDTGHNEAGIKEVLKNITHTPHQQLHWVFGMVKDKDISQVLSLLPTDAMYYFCAPNLPRALPALELNTAANRFHLQGKAFETVALALADAQKNAQPQDLILIGGSTFVVAEAIP